MKKFKYIWILIFLTIATQGIGQDLEDKLLSWLENNNRETLINKLDQVNKAYPDSPLPLFLEAFIEYDAEHAVKIYKQIVNDHPKTIYAEASMLKLGEYYFIIGSYVTAREWFNEFIKKYPRSEKRTEAMHLAALCLVATENYEKAEKEIRKIIKKYPNSVIKTAAEEELERIVERQQQEKSMRQMISSKDQSRTGGSPAGETANYMIQVGAFKDKENAVRQKEFFMDREYTATIGLKNVDNQLFYCVRLGSFFSQEQAEDFGENLKQKYGVTYQVVKND